MNVIVTGRGGSSGSWKIRGEQLGAAIGATVLPGAIDIDPFDVAVVVKRTPGDLVARIHRAGVPLVYDIVDGWPQPEGNDWSREQCMAWLRSKVREVRPTAIVAATQAMAADCEEFGVPVLALPHHARPGLARTPIRPLKRVGYEGGPQHLGRWRAFLDRECARRGWVFHVNPPSINDLDVVVALRERTGYAPTKWKSAVKMANAQASGTPMICASEAGYRECASGAEVFADAEAEVAAALDLLTPVEERRARADHMAVDSPTLEAAATAYKSWLAGLLK